MNGARDPLGRTLWIIAVAVILPASIVVALDLSFGLARQRSKIEEHSLDIAEKISLLADARIKADFATMSVLGTAVSLKAADWRKFYERAREVKSLNPGWRSVVLSDLTSQREILDLRVPDLAMPGIDAQGLARMARTAAADLRGLVMSAFADRAIDAANGIGAPLLRKPFASGELIAAVEGALAA